VTYDIDIVCQPVGYIYTQNIALNYWYVRRPSWVELNGGSIFHPVDMIVMQSTVDDAVQYCRLTDIGHCVRRLHVKRQLDVRCNKQWMTVVVSDATNQQAAAASQAAKSPASHIILKSVIFISATDSVSTVYRGVHPPKANGAYSPYPHHSFLPSSTHFLYLTPPFPSPPCLPLPLEVGPLNPVRGLGSAVSSASRSARPPNDIYMWCILGWKCFCWELF